MTTAFASLPPAQRADPITWFARPWIPIMAAILVFLYGIASTVALGVSAIVWLEALALVLATAACAIASVASRPLRGAMGWPAAITALTLATAATALSALAAAGGQVGIDRWWAPCGLALTIVALTPYLAPRRLVILGSAATIIAPLVTIATIGPGVEGWSPAQLAVIVAYPPLLATSATAVFSASIVRRTVSHLNRDRPPLEASAAEVTEAADAVAATLLERLTAHATPFLRQVAGSGRISAEDRLVAGELARRLRDELVANSNRTWLETFALGTRLTVVDPLGRARLMTLAERTGVRAVLGALLSSTTLGPAGVRLELSRAGNGATDALLTAAVSLADSQRARQYEPYFLTLSVSVDRMWVESLNPLRVALRMSTGPDESHDSIAPRQPEAVRTGRPSSL